MNELLFAAHTVWGAFVEDALGLILVIAVVVAVRLTVNKLSQ